MKQKIKKKRAEDSLPVAHQRGPPLVASAQPTSGLVVFYPAPPSCSLERGARRRRHGDVQVLLGLPLPLSGVSRRHNPLPHPLPRSGPLPPSLPSSFTCGP